MRTGVLIGITVAFCLFIIGNFAMHMRSSHPEQIKIHDDLSYIVLKEAHDPQAIQAAPGKKVTVHYTGWLSTESQKTPFDSSRSRNTPFSFTLGAKQVISGWEMGVKGMKVGEIRELTIGPNLAYGARGIPGRIPPQSTLMFEVELLEVEK